MKKLLFFIGILAVTLISCGKKEVNNDWKDLFLQGKVKTLKVEKYSASSSFGEIVEDELESTQIYEFNKNGFLVASSDQGYRDYTYSYTYKGDTTTMLVLRDNVFYYKAVNVYDSQHNLLESTEFDSNGDISEKTINKYSDNQLVQLCKYDEDGDLWRKHSNYVYKEDKLQSYKIYDNDGDLYETIYFKYDENGFIAEKKENDSDGKTKYRWRYKRDQYGNIVHYNFKGSRYENEEKYELTYDSHHNVIKQVTIDKDNDYEIEIRTITYF